MSYAKKNISGNLDISSALLDWLQMLTGAVLVLFIWSHMALVDSINISPDIMNAVARFFEATFMAQIGGPIVGAIFLLHFMLAARKIPFRTEEVLTYWKLSRLLRHTDTWLWLIQVFTAMIILLMGSIHIWTVLVDLPITASKSAARVQGVDWLVFYLILLPIVAIHVGIGFYRIFIKWGFVQRKGRKILKWFLYLLTAIFLLIGLITIIHFLTLPI
jgi:fumarate reductase subunit C